MKESTGTVGELRHLPDKNCSLLARMEAVGPSPAL